MQTFITKRFTFEAAHCLPGHEGLCQKVHGHSYHLEVTVQRLGDFRTVAQGSERGMVIDFSRLKSLVTELVISKLDHCYLNDVYSFRPTAENMAEDIFVKLGSVLASLNLSLYSIRLWETEGAYAEVRQ